MLIGVHIPRFAPPVPAAERGVRLVGTPAALAPEEGSGNRIGEINAPAAAAGVRPGMRIGEAYALCPRLSLHPPDPVAVREAAERLCGNLESIGARVEPVDQGLVLLDAAPLERLLRGLDGVLREAAHAAEGIAPGVRPRLGAALGRFQTTLAAQRARPGRPLVIRPDRAEAFLASLPVDALAPVAPEIRDALGKLGIRRLSEVRELGRLRLRDRFGPDGERAYRLAAGEDSDRLDPRPPPLALRETLALPEPAATEQALWHALRLLLARLLARPERASRAPRSLLVGARLQGGGSWERHVPLREATADRTRLELALRPKLAELPAPADQLAVELGALAPADRQLALLRTGGEERSARIAEAVRQVRSVVDQHAALRIVEVDGESRVPERRFALAPEWE